MLRSLHKEKLEGLGLVGLGDRLSGLGPFRVEFTGCRAPKVWLLLKLWVRGL